MLTYDCHISTRAKAESSETTEPKVRVRSEDAKMLKVALLLIQQVISLNYFPYKENQIKNFSTI